MAKIQKKVSNNLVLGLIAFAVIAFGAIGLTVAYVGNTTGPVFEGDCVNCYSGGGEASFGANDNVTNNDESNLTNLVIDNDLFITADLEVDGTLYADGTLTAAGAVGITGALTGTSAVFSSTLSALRTATTSVGTATIGSTESGRLTLLEGTGATITLPAAVKGYYLKFVTSIPFSTNYVLAAASGDLIDGSLIVNQAPVACANETAVNIVASADLASDWLELYATSTSGWIILGSNFDTTGGATCTGG